MFFIPFYIFCWIINITLCFEFSVIALGFIKSTFKFIIYCTILQVVQELYNSIFLFLLSQPCQCQTFYF